MTTAPSKHNKERPPGNRFTDKLTRIASSLRHKSGFGYRRCRLCDADMVPRDVSLIPVVPDEIVEVGQHDLLMYDIVIHLHCSDKGNARGAKPRRMVAYAVYNSTGVTSGALRHERDLKEFRPVLAGDEEAVGRGVVGDTVQDVHGGAALRIRQ